MKDEGCKIADRDNKKKQFQSHSSCARLPVIHFHPKHDILFVVIPACSCRFNWRQHPRFWSDPASRHDLKNPSSKFHAWISTLSLMHDCCCWLFWCPCVLSLSLSLFNISFSSLPSILNLKRVPLCCWLKKNVYLWLESWKLVSKLEISFKVGKRIDEKGIREGNCIYWSFYFITGRVEEKMKKRKTQCDLATRSQTR